MSGITITPGTFNPPAALVETTGVVTWPAAKSGWQKRRPQQWNSQPVAEEPALEEYDDSAILAPPADLWVADAGGGELWSGRRRIRLLVDWENLPPTAASIRVYDDESGTVTTAVGAGSATFLTRLDFQVRTFGIGISFEYTPVLESEFTPFLNGQDYTSSNGTVHAIIPLTDRPGYTSPQDDIRFARTVAPLCTVSVLDSGGGTLKSWLFQPTFTTTNRMRAGASTNPAILDVPRGIRVSYNADTEVWTLKTPAGFDVP